MAQEPGTWRERLAAGLSRAYSSAYPAVQRVRDLLVTGDSALPTDAAELVLLGEYYVGAATRGGGDGFVPEHVARFVVDFRSRVWMTYRAGFAPLPGGFASDAGWGCTLRTGQMLLAQALVVHVLGRGWRRSAAAAAAEPYASLLRLFGDDPACPFGLHQFVERGAEHGVQAGHWLGPYALCRTIATLVNRHRPGGLVVHVLAGEGDGAAGPAWPSGGAPTLYREAVRERCRAAALSAADAPLDLGERRGGEGEAGWAPLVLLVPLMLGRERQVNACYLGQLRATLGLPQSLGIVGGRPGASLYLLGFQGDSVYYLDPHRVQPAVDPATSTDSYHCETLRRMPMATIDPTLALAFYCRTSGDFDTLCEALDVLSSAAPSCPILTVAERAAPPRPPADIRTDGLLSDGEASESGDAGDGEGDDWTLL